MTALAQTAPAPLATMPHLATSLTRFDAWWGNGLVDRAPVSITAPSGVRPAARPPAPSRSHREARFDIEGVLDGFADWVAATAFVGDSAPMFMPNLGPDVVATLYGAELEFAATTSWSVQSVANVRDIIGRRARFDGVYWQAIMALTRRSLARGAGRWITGVTDLHTNGDVLAALRDSQHLAIDCADDLDGVAEACVSVTADFPAIFDQQWEPIRAAGQPCMTWTPTMTMGRAYPVSCDFICMLSPKAFRRAILPSLVAEMRFLDRSIFHLDGPGALRHLDDLLAVPELDAIQWIYGAGRGPAAAHLDVYRRIQQGGKAMQVVAESIADAKAVARTLEPHGVWLCPGHAGSVAEAEDFIAWVADWSRGVVR